MATVLPVITGPNLPEDFEQPLTLAPVDDDGKPAEMDSTPTVVGTSCDINDLSADGLSFVVTPKLAASAGDTISATVTYVSEGETLTQEIDFLLTAGGVATGGATFGTAVKSTRRT